MHECAHDTCMCTHTHTHAHTRTLHTHIHTPTYMDPHTQHTHIHAHTYKYTHVHTHTLMYTHMQSHSEKRCYTLVYNSLYFRVVHVVHKDSICQMYTHAEHCFHTQPCKIYINMIWSVPQMKIKLLYIIHNMTSLNTCMQP